MKKRKRLLHEEGNEAQKQLHEAVGGRRASGESVKKKREKCPHNRQCRQAMQGVRHVLASPNLETVQAM